MIFIIIYEIVDLNANFQKLCYHVYFFEQNLNQLYQNQILTRCRRFKNSNEIIYVFKYYIDEIICFQQVVRNLKKRLSKTAAILNNEFNDDVTKMQIKN